MNRRFAAPILAISLLLVFAGVASAHTATTTCEHITLGDAPPGSTADVKSGSTVILNDVPGNGTYAIAAGT